MLYIGAIYMVVIYEFFMLSCYITTRKEKAMDVKDSSSSGVYITTTDNPYDPEEQFDEWYSYDESHGYHTCSLLDRVASTSMFGLGEEYNLIQIERAIDEIIEHEGNDLYKKIKK